MAKVKVELAHLLRDVHSGDEDIVVEGSTLEEALDSLVSRFPKLRVHLFDESGAFRQHVLCFLNDTNSRWLETLACPVEDGDVIRIMQAVSGG